MQINRYKTLMIVLLVIVAVVWYDVAHAQTTGTWEQVDPRTQIDSYPESAECDSEPPPEQPDDEPPLADCCTYCVRFTEAGIYTEGSASCAGCADCVQPSGFALVDIAAWLRWLGCQVYFKVACPVICFLSAWLDAIVQWLQSFFAWLPDLFRQVLEIVILGMLIVINLLRLIVQIIVLAAQITGRIFGVLGSLVSGIFNVTPEAVTLPGSGDSDWGLLYCVLEEFDWSIRNSRMILWFVSMVVHVVTANIWWTIKYWTSGDETTERPAQETAEVR